MRSTGSLRSYHVVPSSSKIRLRASRRPVVTPLAFTGLDVRTARVLSRSRRRLGTGSHGYSYHHSMSWQSSTGQEVATVPHTFSVMAFTLEPCEVCGTSLTSHQHVGTHIGTVKLCSCFPDPRTYIGTGSHQLDSLTRSSVKASTKGPVTFHHGGEH